MTINDSWLLESARKKKAASKTAPLLKARLEAVFDAEIDGLWNALRAEIQREAAVYTGALGVPDALIVTSADDEIDVRAADGRRLILQLDRKRRALIERYRDRAGMVRVGRPRVKFSVNTAGRLAFSFGAVQAAAGSVLRRLIG
jgi:hypothetical protein